MAFTSYITFAEYTNLDGTITDEAAFTKVERKAQRYLDYFTFDRIPLLPEVPDVVKEVIVELIKIIQEKDKATSTATSSIAATNGAGLTQYSNGVESMTFDTTSSSSRQKDTLNEMQMIIAEWLPDYLTARSVSFDVGEYLQQDSNGT